MRRKTTIYVEEKLLRAAKVEAATSGRKEYEVFEEALRDYLGWKIIDRVRAQAGLSEADAMEIARDELAAHRREEEHQAKASA